LAFIVRIRIRTKTEVYKHTKTKHRTNKTNQCGSEKSNIKEISRREIFRAYFVSATPWALTFVMFLLTYTRTHNTCAWSELDRQRHLLL